MTPLDGYAILLIGLMALIFALFTGVGFLLILIAVYILPTLIAIWRKTENVLWIGIANLFLGATGFGWLIVMVWALLDNKKENG